MTHKVSTFAFCLKHSLDSDRCPVKSFVKYMRRLKPMCIQFFQQPRKKPIEGIYYNNVPLGNNKIGSMMKSLSEVAGLSKKYTNHSLCAKTVHVLDSARIPSRHIMTVTRHKSESSRKTYSGQTDISTKKLMSRTLSESTISLKSCSAICAPRTLSDRTSSLNNCLMISATNNVPPLNLSSSQELAIIQDIQQDDTFDDGLDDMFMNINIPNNGMPVYRPFPSPASGTSCVQ